MSRPPATRHRNAVAEAALRRNVRAPGSPETRFRRELAWAFGAFELVVTSLAAASELLLGTPTLGYLYLGVLAILCALVLWLWRGGDPLTIGNLLVAVVFLAVTVTSVITGGASVGANIALPVIVLVAVMYSPPRLALAWTALAIAQILFVAWLRRSGLTFPVRPDPLWLNSAAERIPLFFTVGAALIGSMIMRALDRYRADIVASKRAEAEARALAASSTERFTDFAEIAADGFWETDADLRLKYVSPGFARAIGLTSDQMLGLTPSEAYRLRFPSARGVEGFMAPLRARQTFQEQLLAAMDENGNRRWLLNQGRPRFDERGGFLGYRGAVRDVTRQKFAEDTLRGSENRLRLITESTPALIAYFDDEVRYLFCNSLACEVLGMPRERILGRTMREVRGDAVYAGLEEHVRRALEGESVTFEDEGDWNGRHCHFQTTYTPDTSETGDVLGFYAATFDVTRIKESEIALADATRRLQLITDSVPAAISHVDATGRFTFSNVTHAKWLGRTSDQVVGHTVAEIHGGDIYGEIEPHLLGALAGRRSTFELSFANHHYRATYIPEHDESGKVVGVYGLINDITQLKRVEEELRMLAQFDALTGLANRRRFGERLADAIARSERSGQMMAVMFMDIDDFKKINDSLGHKGGDLVLQQFGRRLSATVRRTDTVARLAGDEFVIILEPLSSPEEAATVARKIGIAMQPAFDIEGESRTVSASIGVAIRKPGEVDGEALLRRADEALYDVKSAHRGGFKLAG